jgi:legume-like lectin family protein
MTVMRVPAVFAALSVFISNASAQGWDGFDYQDFSSVTGLTLNSEASQEVAGGRTVLRLSHDRKVSGGSVWTNTPVPTDAFSAYFVLRISDPSGIGDPCSNEIGGDGLAFVLQNEGPLALGGLGSGLGAEGITPALVIEFDNYCSQSYGDQSSNHVGLHTDGDVNHATGPQHPQVDTPGLLDDGNPWHVWVDYDGAQLEMSMSRTGLKPSAPLFVETLDTVSLLGDTSAFVGFVAAGWYAYANFDVLRFEYRPYGKLLRIGEVAGRPGSTEARLTTLGFEPLEPAYLFWSVGLGRYDLGATGKFLDLAGPSLARVRSANVIGESTWKRDLVAWSGTTLYFQAVSATHRRVSAVVPYTVP